MYDGTLVYDPRGNAWSTLHANGSAPGPRYATGLVAGPAGLYLFGGTNASGELP